MASSRHLRELIQRLRTVLRRPATRVTAAVLGVVCGGAVVVLSLAVGHCSFMAGICPADPEPWWRNDVFGSVAAGLTLAVAGPLLAWRPNRRGLAAAVVVVVLALPVAWLLAEAARTGSW